VMVLAYLLHLHQSPYILDIIGKILGKWVLRLYLTKNQRYVMLAG
jgi:hypothetical protein